MNPQMSPMERDWSTLPSDLLHTIATKLSGNFIHIIQFGGVCTSWRSISLLQKHVPWLMLSNHDTNPTHRGFFSLSDRRVYWLDLPTPPNVRFCGSSNGWLVLVDEMIGVTLLNPITKSQISLPNLLCCSSLLDETLDKSSSLAELIRKVVVVVSSSSSSSSSSSPSSSHPMYKTEVDLIIMMSRRMIAICKPGDRSWRFLSLNFSYDGGNYSDVYYSDGKLYAVTSYGSVMVYRNIVASKPFSEQIKKPQNSFRANQNYYIVELLRELFLVSRYREQVPDVRNAYRTVKFEVFKRDGINDGKWERTKSLGGCALFLGHNQSSSLAASNFSAIKPDFIYFADTSSKDFVSAAEEPHDVGIFDLKRGRVKSLPGYNRTLHFAPRPPIWVTTSPWYVNGSCTLNS